MLQVEDLLPEHAKLLCQELQAILWVLLAQIVKLRQVTTTRLLARVQCHSNLALLRVVYFLHQRKTSRLIPCQNPNYEVHPCSCRRTQVTDATLSFGSQNRHLFGYYPNFNSNLAMLNRLNLAGYPHMSYLHWSYLHQLI